MPNHFLYQPEQAELLPRHVRDELPQGHLCFRIHQIIEEEDLREFDAVYREEGQQAYNPRLMLKVWQPDENELGTEFSWLESCRPVTGVVR